MEKTRTGKGVKMRLTVGEIAKVLGLPSESIRYYVREGLIQPAKAHGIKLTGEIYGRERTNFYVDKKRHWVCSIYAPIVVAEKDEK